MDLIEEIKLEFEGMKNFILKLTKDSTIESYFTYLGTTLNEGNTEIIKEVLKKINEWLMQNYDDLYYIAERQSIPDGEGQFSRYLKLQKTYISELENYKPLANKQIVTTSQYENIIFLSHSSADVKIGEALMDLLITLGVKKKDIFFSSKYHTGVELGKDFPEEVKENLKKDKITIFLLTEDFYRSEYCLNEMGAIWILDKPYIPFLLGGLEPKDMKGFIGDSKIALEPESDQLENLFYYLKDHYGLIETNINRKELFQKFCEVVKQFVKEKPKEKIKENMTETDKIILTTRFTDNELLLLSYFKDYQVDSFNEFDTNDIEFNEWQKGFAINLEKTKNLLINFSWFYIQSNLDEYYGCKLDHTFFRELLDLSYDANEKLETIKRKKQKITQVPTENELTKKEHTDIEKLIVEGKLSEEELLLLAYMSETSTYKLGDRWMAEGQINSIKNWESKEGLIHFLSINYEKALNKFKIRNYLIVESRTSYGNPREYKLIDEIAQNMINFSPEAKNKLDEIKVFNSYEYNFAQDHDPGVFAENGDK